LVSLGGSRRYIANKSGRSLSLAQTADPVTLDAGGAGVIYRILSIALFAGGLVLLGVAMFDYSGWPDSPEATIEDTESGGQLAVRPRQTSKVAYRLLNPTRHLVQVVGLTFC